MISLPLSSELLSGLSLSIEQLVNTALDYDPGSRAQLGVLQGKSAAFIITDLKLGGRIQILDRGIYLQLTIANDEAIDHDSDVHVSGKLADITRLLLKGQESLAGTGVKAHGDLPLLSTLRHIFSQLDIDISDAIANKLGSVPAYFFEKIMGATRDHLKQTTNLAELSKNYIVNEAQLLPARDEMALFTEDCSLLRSDVDRFAEKIRLLQIQQTNQQEHS